MTLKQVLYNQGSLLVPREESRNYEWNDGILVYIIFNISFIGEYTL